MTNTYWKFAAMTASLALMMTVTASPTSAAVFNFSFLSGRGEVGRGLLSFDDASLPPSGTGEVLLSELTNAEFEFTYVLPFGDLIDFQAQPGFFAIFAFQSGSLEAMGWSVQQQEQNVITGGVTDGVLTWYAGDSCGRGCTFVTDSGEFRIETVEPVPVPESTTTLGVGILGLGLFLKKKVSQ